jgi:hypothetical protein
MRHLAVFLAFLAPQGEPVRLACTADTMISMHEGEEALNHGGRPNFRLKGIEDLALLDFDVSPLKGRCVAEARLFLFPLEGHKLKTLGISSVGTAWKEGEGSGKPARQGEPCYLEAARGERPWGVPGRDLHAVTFGRGGSIWASRDLRPEKDGWMSVEAPPAILHAMAEGNSFGLALSDDKGQTHHNNTVYSREQSGKSPFIQILKWGTGAAPASGARRFSPPPPAAKTPDRSGEFLKKPAPVPSPAAAALADGCRYRVLHEGETRLDAPAAGRLWDGRTITLAAARGAHVGFGIAVEVPAGESRAVRLEGEGWAASRAHPVGASFDPLGPVDGEISGKGLFHVERHVPRSAPPGEQKLTLVLRTGKAEASIPVVLRVHSAVLPDALSFHVSLNSYGSPGDTAGDRPGTPGFLELERSFHRLAHEHRATLALVPYTQRGSVEPGWIPDVRRDGTNVEVASWGKYDARLGPYLDGSAFKGLPRDGVPLAHLYWPHHENWPLPINDHYAYRGKAEDHWRDAPPPDEAFPEAYGKAFSSLVRAFARHALEKDWTRTEYHVFLNNKPDIRFTRREPEGAWWRLDEPVSPDDHLALRYFAARTKEAMRDVKGVTVKFRADLSRPQCRRDTLDGLLDLDVVAGSYRQYPELVFGRGEDVWIYGGLPAPGGSGQTGVAWAIQSFLEGADGFLPWQTVGTSGAWTTPEDTALLLPPQKGMERRAHATLRLKSLRRGQQDVEILRLLLAKLKASREEVRTGVAEALGLRASFIKTSEADAGRLDYGSLDPDRFEVLRRAVLAALEAR